MTRCACGYKIKTDKHGHARIMAHKSGEHHKRWELSGGKIAPKVSENILRTEAVRGIKTNVGDPIAA